MVGGKNGGLWVGIGPKLISIFRQNNEKWNYNLNYFRKSLRGEQTESDRAMQLVIRFREHWSNFGLVTLLNT